MQTLFGRTAVLLVAAFALLMAATLAVVWVRLVEPLATRTADGLAARMVLAAQTWAELPPATRPDYELELAMHHGLELGAVQGRLPQALDPGDFDRRVAQALAARLREPITLKRGPDPAWAWAEWHQGGHLLRVGYRRTDYALAAPWEAAAVLLAGALGLTLLALALVRHTSLQLRALARQAAVVAQGRLPEPLPETGAAELMQLTRAFNRMAAEVQALLDNRTTLLAGISHDLKTPLTRLRLSLALLDGRVEPPQLARLEAEVEEMQRLIDDMLTLARSLRAEPQQTMDLAELVGAVVDRARAGGAIAWRPDGACPWPVAPQACSRILANLLDNAQRYGGGQPVEVELACGQACARVRVLDRGPGIPAHEREAVFRPFYRLEASRSRASGGSGLGLAIARQLADAHGWRIELKDRPGGGLVAELVLPRASDLTWRDS
ncbi:MAG: ATP-binding protein [Thiobacillaceae bacterium]|nr:ATP-binding protein [Thiobacillaceae bacterium]MDW8324573.1 ATP-binding protein [Burkholderiales bacterium]